MTRGFPTTRWSVVLSARGATSRSAREALSSLCEAYWYPLYLFARRRGHGADEALDLTQGFFTYLLERNVLDGLRPGVGRFRSFLLSTLRHWVSHERDRARAEKRGGGRVAIPLDAESAETRYVLDTRFPAHPEKAFERAWAETILEGCRHRVREEYRQAGKGRLFDRLESRLTGARPQPSYQDIARELDLTESAVKMSVLRLRRHFGRLLREEIGHTVDDAAEVDDELRHLLAVVQDR